MTTPRTLPTDLPSAQEVARLNALPKRPGAPRLFATTVARPRSGRWLLMNRQETGWASACRSYQNLEALLWAWDVEIAGAGVDRWSAFLEIRNRSGDGGVAC